MSGWEPGWQPAGDAPQRPPEPNGLPGPATDLSPAEPGWQDQPVRYPNSLLERTGWSPDPHLGRQPYSINQPGPLSNSKSYQPSNPNQPSHASSSLRSVVGLASVPPINTNYVPQLDQTSRSFDNSPVDLQASAPFGSPFEHTQAQAQPGPGTGSQPYPNSHIAHHHASSTTNQPPGNASLMGAYAQSGYSSAHPFLPTAASSSAPRYAPNTSHFRAPYQTAQPAPSPYYNWPGAHYQQQQQQQQQQAQPSSYPYLSAPSPYTLSQPGYGYPPSSSSAPGPGGYPTDQHWRVTAGGVDGHPGSSAELSGRVAVDGEGVGGSWGESRSGPGQAESWMGSGYNLAVDQHPLDNGHSRYPLPPHSNSTRSSSYRPGNSLEPGTSPRSVPSRLRPIDELDQGPVPAHHFPSTSTEASPTMSPVLPGAFSSFYGGQPPAQLDQSDSGSSLRRSGTAKRARTSADSTESASKPPSTAAKGKKAASSADGPPKRKLTVDLEAKCRTCGVVLARLICRGTAEEVAVPHKAVFTCLNCTPNAKPISNKRASTSASASKSKSKTVQPLMNTSTSVNTFRKRNKKSFSDPSALTPCDVCLRDIATGAVLADDSETEVGFTVEVVCVQCDERYMRCSDCGGGGGSRLGAGKWRCRELFVTGRKTCKLSHDRLGNLTEMDYDVFAIRDVPVAEMTEILRQSETIFKNTLIAGMCIPEVLETQSAPFRNYEDIIQMIDNGWRAIQQLFRVDIEPTRSIRRYIGLRSTTPNPRKSQRARAAEAERQFQQGGVVLRPNKDIVGFVLAELDFLIGSLFLAVVVPWGTADMFDATTRMLVTLVSQAGADLDEMNAFRVQASQPRLPEVKHIWTLMFFKRESRMMAHLEKKRGFIPMAEYLAKYPDSTAAEFAPEREVYIPRERQGGEWHVVVKRQLGVDDWTRPVTSAGAGVGRG